MKKIIINGEEIDIGGKDATINGQNTLEIVAGENVSIEQEDGTLTISATGGSSDGGGEVYSTEETRIGTWIDGRPLYRKCFVGTASVNNGSASTIAYFPNIIPINIYGFLLGEDSANSICPLNFIESNNAQITATITVWYIYNEIKIKTWHLNGAFNGKPVRVVVEYTKTTDQATA